MLHSVESFISVNGKDDVKKNLENYLMLGLRYWY